MMNFSNNNIQYFLKKCSKQPNKLIILTNKLKSKNKNRLITMNKK